MEITHYGVTIQEPNIVENIQEEIMRTTFEKICRAVYNDDGEWERDE